MAKLLPLNGIGPVQIETLLDRAFGADRHARTAYKLRRGSDAIAALSFALFEDDRLVASLQCWPVRIGATTLVLVGPVAVDPDHQNEGHGQQLMQTALEAAARIGNPALVMIGDPEYYGRFGFTANATAGWTLPGPWKQHRLLTRNAAGHPLPMSGMLERADAL